MSFKRELLEGAIERLIDMLDEMDDDAYIEEEYPEEQHDFEADLTWSGSTASTLYVIAERARRKALAKQ